MMTKLFFSGNQHREKITITMNIPTQLPIATVMAIVMVTIVTIVTAEVTMIMEALMEEDIMEAMEATRFNPRSQDLTAILLPTSNVRRQVRLYT